MKVPMMTQLVILSEKDWNEIEKAVADGDTVSLIRILEPENVKKSTELIIAGKEKIHKLQKEVEADKMSPMARYFVYNSIPYDMPKEQVMDMAMRFADENHLSDSDRKKIRYIVANIDEDYLKYESQYNESVRQFMSEDNLTAMLTEEDEIAYHQEEYREYKEEEEEKEESK